MDGMAGQRLRWVGAQRRAAGGPGTRLLCPLPGGRPAGCVAACTPPLPCRLLVRQRRQSGEAAQVRPRRQKSAVAVQGALALLVRRKADRAAADARQ